MVWNFDAYRAQIVSVTESAHFTHKAQVKKEKKKKV